MKKIVVQHLLGGISLVAISAAGVTVVQTTKGNIPFGVGVIGALALIAIWGFCLMEVDR